MRGDKRTPTALRVLKMTGKQAEKLLKRQIPTPGDLVDPPDWLTEEQKLDWAYAIENAPRGVLKKIDKGVLAGYLVAQDLHRQAAEQVRKTQMLVKSPKQGLPMQNPFLAILNRQYTLMLRGASELGFTPCARARLESGNPPQPAADSWDDVAAG